MRGELLVNLQRAPITGMPQLEALPKFTPLLAPYGQHCAVATGMQSDVSFAIELKFVSAREMPKPAAFHLEIAGIGS
jgi:hypothetical protein